MEKKLIENVKEAAFLVVISAGIGFLVKKMLKKNLTNDPSTDLMNAATWTCCYDRIYLCKRLSNLNKDYLFLNSLK